MTTMKHIAALLAAAASVAGCTQQKAPECFAPETIELVKDIVSDMAANNAYPLASKAEMMSLVQIETPIPTAYDKDVHRFSCEGSISIPNELPPSDNITQETDPETLQKMQDADGVLCPSNRCQTMIEFTSQTVSERHVVSVQGLPQWLRTGLALRAQVKVANRNAQTLADEVTQKARLVSTCDNPATLQQLKLGYAEKLFRRAEQQMAMNETPFSAVTPKSIDASARQLEEALSVRPPQKIRLNLNPVSLECKGEVYLTANPGYSDDVQYLVEPVEGSNGASVYVSVTPEFGGENVRYQNLIDMREFLMSKMPPDPKL